jgi:membrane protease YdiL (CAAX protease family)
VLGTLSGLAVKLSPGKGMDEAMKGIAPPFIPLLILVASAVEELAMRGWLQGFLEPLRGRVVKMGPVTVSVPVLTSSLTFGAWHLPVILFDPWTGCIVVVFTTLLGYLAATARERSSGLAPAVWTHIAGNVGGILAGILYTVVHMAMGGAPPTMP